MTVTAITYRYAPRQGSDGASSQLTCCLRGSCGGTEWHGGAKQSAACGLRIDGEIAIDQLEPLTHAGEAEAAAGDRLFRIKPDP